jgi:Kef-type K+ transport system membrane component KefB
MDDRWLIAMVWMGLALAASIISMRSAVSVALVEILVGVFAGNIAALLPDSAAQLFHSNDWINFLAGFGSVLLTFLAGAEIEPAVLRKYLKESLAIGFLSFLFPFLGAAACVYFFSDLPFFGHWDFQAAGICGVALSTTSVAVVYAVMVETGLNETQLGKLILAACFVTDLGTVLALGVLFAHYDWWLLVFLVVSVVVLAVTPKLANWFFRRFADHVSEPSIKFLFFLLFGLGALAVRANSEAVLPAYLIGLMVATTLAQNRDTVRRLRTTVFSLLTPFYFLKAGSLVSLKAVVTGLVLIVILLAVKIGCKFIGVWPLTRLFRFGRREGHYTTLLMSTGLTFGTISALFGYNRGIITQDQYTVLVTVVIASAIVPTMIAQAFFKPHIGPATVEDIQGTSGNSGALEPEELSSGEPQPVAERI